MKVKLILLFLVTAAICLAGERVTKNNGKVITLENGSMWVVKPSDYLLAKQINLMDEVTLSRTDEKVRGSYILQVKNITIRVTYAGNKKIFVNEY